MTTRFWSRREGGVVVGVAAAALISTVGSCTEGPESPTRPGGEVGSPSTESLAEGTAAPTAPPLVAFYCSTRDYTSVDGSTDELRRFLLPRHDVPPPGNSDWLVYQRLDKDGALEFKAICDVPVSQKAAYRVMRAFARGRPRSRPVDPATLGLPDRNGGPPSLSSPWSGNALFGTGVLPLDQTDDDNPPDGVCTREEWEQGLAGDPHEDCVIPIPGVTTECATEDPDPDLCEGPEEPEEPTEEEDPPLPPPPDYDPPGGSGGTSDPDGGDGCSSSGGSDSGDDGGGEETTTDDEVPCDPSTDEEEEVADSLGLACSQSSITRGEPIGCTASTNNLGAQLEWSFVPDAYRVWSQGNLRGDLLSLVQRPTTTTLTWSGRIVASGTISVQIAGSVAAPSTWHVTVTPRDVTKLLPSQIPRVGYIGTTAVDTAGAHVETSTMSAEYGDYISGSPTVHTVADGGPNDGYAWVTTVGYHLDRGYVINRHITPEAPRVHVVAPDTLNNWDYLLHLGHDPSVAYLGTIGHETVGSFARPGMGHYARLVEFYRNEGSCGDVRVITERAVASASQMQKVVTEIRDRARVTVARASSHNFVHSHWSNAYVVSNGQVVVMSDHGPRDDLKRTAYPGSDCDWSTI